MGLQRVVTGYLQAEEESLGNKCGTQTQEQWHRNFSNLVLTGKLREAIHFICELETGEGYYLMNGRIQNQPLWIRLSWKYWQ